MTQNSAESVDDGDDMIASAYILGERFMFRGNTSAQSPYVG